MGMSDAVKQLIDVAEEKDSQLAPKLAGLSKKHKAVLLTLIAPYVGRQLTPTKISSAHIGLSEEFAIETVIDEIKAKINAKTLLLLVNSPGGYVQSSYKV